MSSKKLHPDGPDIVTQTCNPSYPGGGDQEHLDSRATQAKSSQDPTTTNKSLARWHAPVIPAVQEV
jgi:hypothetical protein